MDKKWNDEINNNDNLIDGLDGCNLIDSSEEQVKSEYTDTREDTSSKDGFIDIRFIDDKILGDPEEQIVKDNSLDKEGILPFEEDMENKREVELTYTQEEKLEGEEKSNQVESFIQEETNFKEENDKPKEEYLFIHKDKDTDEGYIPIQEEPIDEEQARKIENLKQQNQWGRDLGDFPVEKNKNIESKSEDDSYIKIESVDEVDPVEIPITSPEVALDRDDVDVNIVKPKDFKELIDVKGEKLENYISGNSKFSSISENISVCIELCKLFASVHSTGHCFNGITANDIIVTPSRECKLVNDKKIVSPDDDTYQVNYEKTCAPEVLKNEARPNINTDKHSMAFLLFGLFFRSNPFEGAKILNTACYTKEEEFKAYENPVFVYSYKDKSNMPVYGIHSVLIKYWNRFYSDDIKMIFQQTFVDGIKEPEARAEDKTCIEILTKFKAVIDSKNPKTEPAKKEGLKEKLKIKIQPKLEQVDSSKDFDQNTIEINKDEPKKPIDESIPKYQLCIIDSYLGTQTSNSQVLDLTPGIEIPNSLVGYEGIKPTQVIGKVIQNSKHKGVLGIKNLSNHEWIAYKGSGKKSFPPGKVLVLTNGVSVDFYPENQSATKTKWYIQQK